jgi:transposase InsO family protein
MLLWWLLTDLRARWTVLIPTYTHVTAPEAARLLFDNISRDFSMPESTVSDRDTRFTSSFWQHLYKCMGTKLRMSSAYHPQTDGLTERMNRTVEQVLRKYVNDVQDDWDEHLPAVQFSLNTLGFRVCWAIYSYKEAVQDGLSNNASERLENAQRVSYQPVVSIRLMHFPTGQRQGHCRQYNRTSWQRACGLLTRYLAAGKDETIMAQRRGSTKSDGRTAVLKMTPGSCRKI